MKTFPLVVVLSASALWSSVAATQALLPEGAADSSALQADGWLMDPESPKDAVGAQPVDAGNRPSSAEGASTVVRIHDLSDSASVSLERDLAAPITGTGRLTFQIERLNTSGQGVQSAIRFRLGNQGLRVNSLENSAFSLALRSDGDLTVEAGGSPAFVTIRGAISQSPAAITVLFNAGTEAAEVEGSAESGSITVNPKSFVLLLDDILPAETPAGGFPFQVVPSFNPDAGIGRVGFVSASAAAGGDIAVWNLQLEDSL